MTTLTLLVKASNSSLLKRIVDLLKEQFEGLDLEITVLGNTVNRWVQVSLIGEDEAIATSYIKKNIGLCPTTLDGVSESTILKGYISKVDQTKQEIKVDIGVFEPKIIEATISLASLRAQLVGGKKADFKKLAELFGLYAELPVNIKITSAFNQESGELGAELSVEQAQKLLNWQQSLLDRLIVLRSSRGDIELVLERASLNRDVIELESLGLFEHALTCKLGTDAAGLIPMVGRYMRNARFIVFNPKKLGDLIGELALNL